MPPGHGSLLAYSRAMQLDFVIEEKPDATDAAEGR